MTGTDSQPPSDAQGFDDDAWLTDDDEPAGRRFPRAFTMRHPVLLVLVVAGAVFMAVQSWPSVRFMVEARTPADCGDLTERPILRTSDPQKLPELRHNLYCKVSGVVESRTIYATGEAAETTDPRQRHAGRKYFLKLAGDNVFAVIAADRPEVVDYRLKKGSLLGFEVHGPGRLIQPSGDAGFQNTERFLRGKFAGRVAEDRPLWLYDTTDVPGERWPHALIFALMVFTAGLAGFGLFRLARERLRSRAAS
ncbi:MAG: hypothetical protein KC613_02125 [Myxococcales bacterium]|nr:hypothetical protein [Myxococcales bacterium]MCB9523036.1 hypothetical protein [Myxococcales bacterium]